MLQVSVEPRSRTPPLDALPGSGAGGIRADAVAGSGFLHLRSGGTPVERRKKPPSGRRSLRSNSTSRRQHARGSAPSKRGRSARRNSALIYIYIYVYIYSSRARLGNITGGAVKTPPVKEQTLAALGIDGHLAKEARVSTLILSSRAEKVLPGQDLFPRVRGTRLEN